MMFRTFRSRALRGAAAAATLGLALTACGSSTSTPAATAGPGATTPSATPTPESDDQVIDITLDGKTVKPSGSRVEVELGEPVLLRITAALAGELHVHSSPEREIAYPKGYVEVSLTIDQPGIVDVEDHALGALIVQLEVS